MRLTDYTDYTLRVLMFCAVHPERPITLAEIAESHSVSKNHLMKIVNDLARQGVLETTRGRGGGLRLMKDARQIRVGDVVRASETDFRLVECFDPDTNRCALSPSCRLKGLFHKALKAYFKELDGMTLADLTAPFSSDAETEVGTVLPPAERTLASVATPVSRRQTQTKPQLDTEPKVTKKVT